MGLSSRPRTYHPERPATNAERQQRFARKRAEELCRLRQKLAQKVYHQSKRTTWETPQEIFDAYDAEFHFTLDVCATAQTAKCPRYFSPEQDGLRQDWGTEICWMNPPFSQVRVWLRKALDSANAGATVICLVKHTPGVGWGRQLIAPTTEVRALGRVKFVGAKHQSPFDVALVIFRPPLAQAQPAQADRDRPAPKAAQGRLGQYRQQKDVEDHDPPQRRRADVQVGRPRLGQIDQRRVLPGDQQPRVARRRRQRPLPLPRGGRPGSKPGGQGG